MSEMSVSEAKSYLSKQRTRLGASSCTFFIKDPIWPDEYHLVAMPGVRYPEMMYGFASGHSRAVLVGGGSHEEVIQFDKRWPAAGESVAVSPTVRPELLELYGDFREREHVKSMVRLVAPGRRAILFVNFTLRQRFERSQMAAIRMVFKRLVESVDFISDSVLAREGPSCLREIVSLFRPSQTTATLDLNSAPNYDLLATMALNAVGLTEGTGLATIHLCRPDAERLDLVGVWGDLDYPDDVKRVDISSGRGVIGWVAHKKKSLMLPDVRRGRCARLYIKGNDRSRSELAVPILAGNDLTELVGVLNLEAFRRGFFAERSIKSVWYAANKVAVAYRLTREAARAQSFSRTSRSLLDLCSRASDDEESRQAGLAELPELVKTNLHASECELWWWDSETQAFRPGGATHREIEQPRSDGWSRDIIDALKVPTWLAARPELDRPAVSLWQDHQWKSLGGDLVVKGIHPRISRFRGNLAIPIKVNNSAAGVAWVRYADRVEPPDEEAIRLALGLAAQVGMVTECLQNRRPSTDARAIEQAGSRLRNGLFNSRSLDELLGGPGALLEGFVALKPCEPNVAGDFYSVAQIDEDTVGLLVADAQGHGLTGLFNALPFFGAFSALKRDTRHPGHIMDHLAHTAHACDVTCAALYAVVTRETIGATTRKWVAVTAAGNIAGVVVHRDGRTSDCPAADSRGCRAQLGPYPWTDGAAADSIEVHTGDLLLFYSDGISEAIEKRQILALALKNLDGGLSAIATEIVNAAEKARDKDSPDDALVLVVRVAG